MERTLIIFKPDSMMQAIVGKILSRFEDVGLRLIGAKMMQFNEQLLREHYAHLSDKPFFGSIVDYMTSHPVLLVVLTGKNAVSNVRKMVGATDPNLAENRTIRKDFGRDKTHNVIHASDSIEGAELEIDRFFSKNELVAYVS